MHRWGLGLGLWTLAAVTGGCADDEVFGETGAGDGSSDQMVDADYCDPVSDWANELTEAEEEVLVLVNEARQSGGICGGTAKAPVPPLQMSAALRCAARVHSKDMRDREFFDHDNPDGEDPFERMERAGYQYRTAGENIAFNYPDARTVVQGWLDSPGHCGNIMNPDFTEIGVGYYAEGGSGHMWTQTFGTPL